MRTSSVGPTAILMVLSCFALGTAIPTAAQKVAPDGRSAAVVAHLALPGPSVTQMLLQRQNGKLYLYADQGDRKNIAVVDVTRPNHPRVIGHVTWPSAMANANVEPLGSGLAMSEARESGNAPHDMNIMDLADPAHPRVLAAFSGVTSAVPNVERNLIFIANSDGLWIVRNRVGQAAYAANHRCTSEAALTPEPDCY